MLSRMNLIAAVDCEGGIGKNGGIPWKSSEDMDFFRNETIGNGNNAVIMGRTTYESIGRPLRYRTNIVITSTEMRVEGIKCCRSLREAITDVEFDSVFVIGGARLYTEALSRYRHLIDKVLISNIPLSFDCDVFFPSHLLSGFESVVNGMFTTFITKSDHPEQVYLNLLEKILSKGERRPDRTGTGTRSLFGCNMEFDLREGFPLFTTKNTWWKGIRDELLFFISGNTDTKILSKSGIRFWDDNTSREFLDRSSIRWEEGDMGPGYGFQWRHWGESYRGCGVEYRGLDQLSGVIESIRKDPFGRRHIVTAWNPSDLSTTPLPPCHCFFQFYVGAVDGVPTFLDCSLYQRSGDMFLGVPFNVASYSLLLSIVASVTDLVPRKLFHTIGDAHIYENHIDQVRMQLKRSPLPLPTLWIDENIRNIDNICQTHIELIGYECHGKIVAPMAI